MNENEPGADEVVRLLAESYMLVSQRASDIAYARRTMYEAYMLEGFTAEEALDLCKIL